MGRPPPIRLQAAPARMLPVGAHSAAACNVRVLSHCARAHSLAPFCPQFTDRLLSGIVALGAFPNVQIKFDITPVDFVAAAIAHISLQPLSRTQVPDARCATVDPATHMSLGMCAR